MRSRMKGICGLPLSSVNPDAGWGFNDQPNLPISNFSKSDIDTVRQSSYKRFNIDGIRID
jgi:hypothetical protein